jgi:hypothetical protein
MASVMTSFRFRCQLFSRNGLILLRIKGLYFETSPCSGHGSGSAAGSMFNSISWAARIAGGRFLRSYPYVRQELQIIPLVTRL